MEQSSAETSLGEIDHNPSRVNIVRAAMEVFCVSKHLFFSTNRSRQYTIARQVAAFLCRRYGSSLTLTAKAVGYTDHTTVLYSEKVILEKIKAGDKRLQEMVNEVEKRARVLREADLQEIGQWVASRRGG